MTGVRSFLWNGKSPLQLPEILTLILFAYISWVPYYYLQPLHLGGELPSFFLPKYLPFLLCGAVALVWSVRLWQGEQSVRLYPQPWALLYLTASLLSLLNADYPWIGLGKWGYYHITGLFFGYVVAQYLRDWGAVERLVSGIALIAGLSATYALFSHLQGRDYLWGELQQLNNPYYGNTWRLTAPFGNAVSTASYLALCLPLMAWKAAFFGRRREYRWLFTALAAIAFFDILFTQSRGGWLTIGVAICVAVFMLGGWAWNKVQPAQRWAALVVLLLGLPVSTALLSSTGLHRVFAAQLNDMEHRASLLVGPQLEQTEYFRIDQYQNVLELLRQHPLFGVGFGNFTRLYENQRATAAAPERQSPFHTTDNMYLMFAAETGALGLLAVLALLAALFWNTYRTCRLARSAPACLLLAFLAGGGGFLANMATWDPLNDPTLRITFWLLAGIALAAARYAVARE